MSKTSVSDYAKGSDAESSPWYSVSCTSFISVEHPYIVKNAARAIDTLGGPARVNELVSSDRAKQKAGLNFHPSTKKSPSVLSGNVSTQNLLVEISVPRRTGRKRKRESTEPFGNANLPLGRGQTVEQRGHIPHLTKEDEPGNTAYLLRSLQDCAERYEVRVVGRVEYTHRFRSMPDFVFSTTNSPFMDKFRETIEPLNYEAAKRFRFDLSKGTQPNADLIPPPTFTHYEVPFNYSYHQNTSVRQLVDQSGNIKLVNDSTSRKVKTQQVAFDCADIPTAPVDDIAPVDTLDETMQRLIQRVELLMNDRPIWTRRALSNQIPTDEWLNLGRYVYQYVGYEFVSGPWRDTVVKFGIDPRRHPKYRIYQTMTFQIDSEDKILRASGDIPRRGGVRVKRSASSLKSRKGGLDSHIFDGAGLATDGKTWQVCDITDPILQELLATTNLRKMCHTRADGWYHNGTWAKARAISRSKIASLIGGNASLFSSDYATLAQLPDIILPAASLAALLGTKFGRNPVVSVASQIKAMASTPEMSEEEDESTVSADTGGSDSHDDLEDMDSDTINRVSFQDTMPDFTGMGSYYRKDENVLPSEGNEDEQESDGNEKVDLEEEDGQGDSVNNGGGVDVD